MYPAFARNAQVALAIGRPAVHLVMPRGLGSGTPLIQHGHHGDKDSNAGAAMVVECGQHFLRATSVLATQVTLDFLAHFGLIAPRVDQPAGLSAAVRVAGDPWIQSTDFAFVRRAGFRVFTARGADCHQRAGRDPGALRRLHHLHAVARSRGGRKPYLTRPL